MTAKVIVLQIRDTAQAIMTTILKIDESSLIT